MLHLHIPFEGSWTNSFSDRGQPLFTSGKTFNDGQRGIQAVPLGQVTGHTSRVDNVRALNAANPGMTYRVPATYDNTVRGVLARLMGEVCRLSDLEADHPLHELFGKLSYELTILSEHDEIVSLATPPNAIQSGGAGLLPAGNPFYSGGDLPKQLFRHLAGTVQQLVDGEVPSTSWVPNSPTDLILKLEEFKEAQAAMIKACTAAQGDAYVSPFAVQATSIREQLAKLPQPPELDANPDNWNWAGAIVAAKIHALAPDVKRQLIEQGALSAKGNMGGMAMTGKIGQVTAKDMYAGAGCQKAYSTRMPYTAELWFDDPTRPGKKQKFNLGVIKKSGILHIKLDLPPEKSKEVLAAIEDAAVGPLHFGKKGIAYLQRSYIS